MTIISTTGDYLALPNKYISGSQRKRMEAGKKADENLFFIFSWKAMDYSVILSLLVMTVGVIIRSDTFKLSHLLSRKYPEKYLRLLHWMAQVLSRALLLKLTQQDGRMVVRRFWQLNGLSGLRQVPGLSAVGGLDHAAEQRGAGLTLLVAVSC